MAAVKSKRLALDTNLPLDLAEGLEIAHDFKDVCHERGFSLLLSPTAVQELAYLMERGRPNQKALAKKTLTSLLSWGIEPFDIKPVQHGYAERFSKLLRDRRLLPQEENNDGLILAEVSLADIPLLVTSDKHLLDIDGDQLAVAFTESHLHGVTVMHPRNMLRVLQGKTR